MPTPNSLHPFAFVLAVQDLDRSTAYFRDVLGFHADWADASDWRLLSRGQVRVMLGSCPDAVPASSIGDHSYFGYMEVDDVDVLHDEFVRQRALIVSPPADRPYGMREFVAATPDGHRFVVGQAVVRK
ncbi:bleomycin resistance family protein [Paraburkholderia sp. UYCP14C]|uniref:VOC family protein n=1 Tax=Paraburkholderia sp. UYCP14C TaxID=2511130 RepID=UPI00101FB91B|nr:VOC family protein [Paraburkholderia sp. UYCP14C]RZF29769.1 bleomycin resistance family protein [Paraburkholderia sp. UYCP14C]